MADDREPPLPAGTHPVRVIENLFITLQDGTRLAAKLWLPEGAGRVPAILEYLPYRKHDGTRTRDNGLHAYLAARGYACLRVDIRGTGESDGIITDEYTVQEQLDGCEVIDWIAAQDWCDGQVAMIGISWGGFNGLQIAAHRPPALKTVITTGSTDDRYATDVHYVGGCLSKDNFDWSSTMFAWNDLPPDPAVVGPRWREMWLQRLEANRPWILTWLAHQRRDDYWRQGSVCEDFSRITIPVYAVSGWADNYSESVPRLLAGLSGPRRGLIGPWEHSYPHDASVAPRIGWLQEVVRWCDHWLKGCETRIMDEPMLRVWMQEPVPPATLYDARPGRWVGEAVWPSPRIIPQRLPLNPGGRLGGAAGTGTAAISSPLRVGAASGEVGRYASDADWPTDQREDDGGSLVFVTDPLPERLEILGAARLELRLSSDQPLALLAARLNEVAPDGASTRVALGLMNLAHREGHGAPRPLVPGEEVAVTVEYDDIAHAFAAGSRIAVALSTSYWPVAWPSPEPAAITLRLGQSALVLPLRPPDPADALLRPFDAPESAPETPHHRRMPEDAPRRRITRDLLTGAMQVDFPRGSGMLAMPDIGHVHESEGIVSYHITEGDPLSARTTSRFRTVVTRAGTSCEHLSEGTLSCDATHFRVQMRLEARENGEVIFTRDWDERIPRDHL